MDRRAVALVLDEIGTLMELHGENPFRARAFFNAARAVDNVEEDLAEAVGSGTLLSVKGFGPATVEVVRDLMETGDSSLHQDLRSRTPDGLIELLGVPGLGARKIHALRIALGIESLDDLEREAAAGRVASLPGFGVKTQNRLLEGVTFVRSVVGRRRLPEAWAVADWIASLLEAHPDVFQAKPIGELRRRFETVDGVGMVAAVDDPGPVLDAFLDMPAVSRGERGEGVAEARLSDGMRLRLVCVPPEAYACALVQGTGSEAHWQGLVSRAAERGLRLDPQGLRRGEEVIVVEDEAALYRALGLAFVPPELREGTDEIERAAGAGLPRLVERTDLRGCFHNHTAYSDGKATVTEMAEAALARGWRYLGLADHSQFASYAGGLKPARIAEQHREIDAWNAERGDDLWLFKGIEADILPDGRLDYADEEEDVLARFDYVVGSIHSSFGLPRTEQTARVLRALENPHLTFLGHPTGRLLLARRSYEIDLDAVIDTAAERGVGIEINANPRRLELDWRHWRRAKERGVLTAINPDAHATGGLDDVRFGIAVARKGWLTAEDVVNAWSLERVRAHFAKSRNR